MIFKLYTFNKIYCSIFLYNHLQHLSGTTGVLGPDVQRLVQEEHKLEQEPVTELVLPIQTAQDNLILHHTDKAVPAAVGLVALVSVLCYF